MTDKNLEAIASHLQTAKNRHYATIKLKDINHIFQDATSGLPADYNANETSFSLRALELIVNWLKITL
ncbi:hypothetical protein GTQ40_14740 [Flavobacteriaceae bacterium R38]|nr:hypothetical protein [Flavobacteriaceae bacterium R38]